jgi:hypothetical protein
MQYWVPKKVQILMNRLRLLQLQLNEVHLHHHRRPSQLLLNLTRRHHHRLQLQGSQQLSHEYNFVLQKFRE